MLIYSFIECVEKEQSLALEFILDKVDEWSETKKMKDVIKVRLKLNYEYN